MYKTYYFLEGERARDPFAASGAEAARRVDALLPRAAGFAQTRPVVEQIDAAAPPPFAGIAEVWHLRREDALAGGERAAVGSLLSQGVRVGPVFAGLARVALRLAAHHDGEGVKCVFPFRRKSGMSVGAFRQHWWRRHGPIAARTEGALFYLQCHPLDESYAESEPAFDGVTELHWPDLAAARSAMASAQMREEQASDAVHFAAPGSILMLAAREEIVRAP